MLQIITLKRQYLAIIIPLLMAAFLILLTKSAAFQSQESLLAKAITVDFLFSIPLVYFLLIRKTHIPAITIVPVTLLGFLLASYILPQAQQGYLQMFERWGIPLIELTVFSFILLKIRRLRSYFKEHQATIPDFFSLLKQASREILPPAVATLFTTEIAVIYYGFLDWRKYPYTQSNFTYHKNSGARSLLAVLLFMILVETFILHLLLVRWNEIVAWVIFALSIYTALQIFGFIRSIPKRPFLLEEKQLQLRYGIFAETTINLNAIHSVEKFTKMVSEEDNILFLSPLGSFEGHNILINLKQAHILYGLYGKQKKYQQLALFVDEPEAFRAAIQEKIKS